MLEIAADARGLPERLDALNAPELRYLSTSLREVTALVDQGDFWGMDLNTRIQRLGTLGKQVEKRTDAIAREIVTRPLTWWIGEFDPTQRRDIQGVIASAYGIAANLQNYANYGRRTGLSVESMDLNHMKNTMMEIMASIRGPIRKASKAEKDAEKVADLRQYLAEMYDGERGGLIARRADMSSDAPYSQRTEYDRLENALNHVEDVLKILS